MAKTHFRTYLTSLIINLNRFEYVQVATNRFTGEQRAQNGTQTPRLTANLNLFVGPRDKPVNVGAQEFTFLDKPQRPSPGNSGYPAMDEVLPGSVLSAWISKLEQVIDEELSYFVDESPESAAAGPQGFHRINQISFSVPYDQPEQHVVRVVCGVYEDAAFSRQIVSSQINISFASDEFVERIYREASQGATPTAADLLAFRSDNNFFPLAPFVSQPEILNGIGVVASQLYSTLKAKVEQYANIDVPTVMTDFAQNLSALFPAPTSN